MDIKKTGTGFSRGRPAVNEIKKMEGDGKSETLRDLPPSHLKENGKAMWAFVWDAVSSWSEEADYVVIQELCEVYQEKEYLRQSIEMGLVPRTYVSSNKQQQNHPYVNQLRDRRTEMNSLLSQLGMTPRERAKIGALESVVDEALLELRDRQRNRRKLHVGDA